MRRAVCFLSRFDLGPLDGFDDKFATGIFRSKGRTEWPVEATTFSSQPSPGIEILGKKKAQCTLEI